MPEHHLRTIFLDQHNLQVVMDHARLNPRFLTSMITQLEKRGGNRTGEENSLLEWARFVRLGQDAKNDR